MGTFGSRGLRAVAILLAVVALPAATLIAGPGGDERDSTEVAPGQPSDAPPILPQRLEDPEVTPECEAAIRDGLAFLAKSQQRSGRFPAVLSYHVSVTSLAGLAFLAAGETPERGPYAATVRRALDFILNNQQSTGLFFDHGIFRVVDRPMHGHGFATLFVASAYGQTTDPVLRRRCRDALHEAIALTARTQSRDGGWHYMPESGQDEGSVTITQIQGMRAARNAGIDVPKATIDRAVDYIRRSQQPDGGVRYTIRHGDTSVALTVAGIAVMNGAGRYDGPEIEKAWKYVDLNMDVSKRTAFFYYTHFYAAQAHHTRGGQRWLAYWPRIRDQLLRMRGSGPSWNSKYGRVYATALALLTLEVPYRYLPLYER